MTQQTTDLKQEQVKSMPTSLLVSATYDHQKNAAVLKFYEPKSQKIILWVDETGHKPYCIQSLVRRNLIFFQKEMMF